MHYISRRFAATIAALFLPATLALGQEIDFTNTEKFQESIDEITEGKTDEEKEAFGVAMLRVLLSRHPETKDLEGFSAFRRMGELGESFFTTGGEAFDGITSDIIEAEITNVTPQAETTIVTKDDTTTQAAILSCINEKVTLKNPQFDDEQNRLIVDVTNNLNWPIRAYMFNYTIYGDGRIVPVVEDDTGGEISGGIEPGETKTISSPAYADITPYTTISIEVSIRNLFDVEKRSILPDGPRYIGYSDEDSPLGC